MDEKAIKDCESRWVLGTELRRCVNTQSGYFFMQVAALITLVLQSQFNLPFVLAFISLAAVACLMALNYRKIAVIYDKLDQL